MAATVNLFAVRGVLRHGAREGVASVRPRREAVRSAPLLEEERRAAGPPAAISDDRRAIRVAILGRG